MRIMKSVLGFLVLFLSINSTGYASSPDQPYMEAGRDDLQKAKAELQLAEHNKGGHRAKALGYVNAAIVEVNKGIAYASRHNHARRSSDNVFLSSKGLMPDDQPHMTAALAHLEDAKKDLEAAEADKGGHRVKALYYLNKAIDEVNKGIAAGA